MPIACASGSGRRAIEQWAAALLCAAAMVAAVHCLRSAQGEYSATTGGQLLTNAGVAPGGTHFSFQGVIPRSAAGQPAVAVSTSAGGRLMHGMIPPLAPWMATKAESWSSYE